MRACLDIEDDQRGVVMIEFLIAFVPTFVLFLGVVQLALLSAARLVVQHAAVAGARSAVVVLDDDPRLYGGTACGRLTGKARSDDARAYGDFVRKLGMSEDAPVSATPALGGPRMATIVRAVHSVLAAIAPDPEFAQRVLSKEQPASVEQALGSSASSRLAFGLGVYLPIVTAVTFPVAPGSRELNEGLVPHDGNLTLRVTHLVPCAVPIADVLMCQRLRWDFWGKRLSAGRSAPLETEAALRELRLAPLAKQQFGLALGGMRVLVLQAEATLPAQYASYACENTDSGDTRTP
jgi:hypothetical protein